MNAGERWKSKRESLGKTMAEVAAELRISQKYIRGIEEGRFDGFPARVFTIGFIKTLGSFLEEDPEPLIQEYVSQVGDQGANDTQQTVAVRPQWVEKAQERGSRMVYYLLAALAVLFIGTALSWYSSRQIRQVSLLPVLGPKPVPGPAGPQHPTADNASSATASPGGDNLARTAPSVAQSGIPDNVVAVTAGEVSPPFQLYLEANDQTWLMYSMDDADPLDTMLYPGDKISIQAQRKIFLKLGNAGGIVGTLNGSRMAPFGKKGQVRVITLGK